MKWERKNRTIEKKLKIEKGKEKTEKLENKRSTFIDKFPIYFMQTEFNLKFRGFSES